MHAPSVALRVLGITVSLLLAAVVAGTYPHRYSTRKWFVLFDAYRRDLKWFLVVELSWQMCFAMISSYAASSSTTCAVQLYVMCYLFLLHLGLIYWLQPFAEYRERYYTYFLDANGALATFLINWEKDAAILLFTMSGGVMLLYTAVVTFPTFYANLKAFMEELEFPEDVGPDDDRVAVDRTFGKRMVICLEDPLGGALVEHVVQVAELVRSTSRVRYMGIRPMCDAEYARL